MSETFRIPFGEVHILKAPDFVILLDILLLVSFSCIAVFSFKQTIKTEFRILHVLEGKIPTSSNTLDKSQQEVMPTTDKSNNIQSLQCPERKRSKPQALKGNCFQKCILLFFLDHSSFSLTSHRVTTTASPQNSSLVDDLVTQTDVEAASRTPSSKDHPETKQKEGEQKPVHCVPGKKDVEENASKVGRGKEKTLPYKGKKTKNQLFRGDSSEGSE